MEIQKGVPAIQLMNVNKSYAPGKNKVQVLYDISLIIPAGRFIAIMGTSGSGKSTLLHVIGGLTTPDNGIVKVFGEALHEKNDRDLTLFRQQYVGLIFQAFNLLPTMTALHNVCLPQVIAGKTIHDVRQSAENLLQTMGLADRADHYPDELSGGQQQRVAIARALMTKASLLLADEPTGNLDSKTGEQILTLLKRLATNGKRTIIMVTHDPKAAAYADQVITLKDGQILEQLASIPGGI